LKLNSFLNQEHDKNVENAHAHVLRNMQLDRPMISPQTSVFPASVAVLLLGLCIVTLQFISLSTQPLHEF